MSSALPKPDWVVAWTVTMTVQAAAPAASIAPPGGRRAAPRGDREGGQLAEQRMNRERTAGLTPASTGPCITFWAQGRSEGVMSHAPASGIRGIDEQGSRKAR